MDLYSALSTPATLLEICQQLAPSLNGAACRRLVTVADELLAYPTGDSLSTDDCDWLTGALDRTTPPAVERRARELDALAAAGVHLVTVFDAGYPTNLAMIQDRPPFLYYRGTLTRSDARAVAVVGTRAASPAGLRAAHQIAGDLAARAVTIVSGLALGIDSAAHRAALKAGGRTLAVFGTGIDRLYPPANRRLADEVAEHGACISQFWPDMRSARWTFPVRNVVTSGLSIGTVVVEASETSGARIQAQQARRHGKRLFLMRGLVTNQAWATEMARQPGVTVVDAADEVVAAVDADLPTEPALF